MKSVTAQRLKDYTISGGGAPSDISCWCLDGDTFRSLIINHTQNQIKEQFNFLCKDVKLLAEMKVKENNLSALNDIGEWEEFEAGEPIIEEGGVDTAIYFIKEGSAFAVMSDYDDVSTSGSTHMSFHDKVMKDKKFYQHLTFQDYRI